MYTLHHGPDSASLILRLTLCKQDQPFHVLSRDHPARHRVPAGQEARPAALALAGAETLGPAIFPQPAC